MGSLDVEGWRLLGRVVLLNVAVLVTVGTFFCSI